MGVPNIQVPPVGMRVPITPKDLVAPDSVPRKKPQEESKGELDMNLQDEIKSLKQRIAELEQQAKQEQKFPQFGDDYWYVDSDTDVLDIAWYDGEYDQGRLSIGNVFKTKEEAEFVAEKLRVESELREFSRAFKHGGDNYTLNLNHDGGKIVHVYASESYEELGSLYFESRDKAQQAIESIGEGRIKKYIFGMED